MPIDGIRPRFGAPWHFCRLRAAAMRRWRRRTRCRSATRNSSRNRAAALPYRRAIEDPRGRRVDAGAARGERGASVSGGVETRRRRRAGAGGGGRRARASASVEHSAAASADGSTAAERSRSRRSARRRRCRSRYVRRAIARAARRGRALGVEARTRLGRAPRLRRRRPRRGRGLVFQQPLVPSGARGVGGVGGRRVGRAEFCVEGSTARAPLRHRF